ANEAFDDADARGFAEAAVPRANPTRLAPAPEGPARELAPMIRDDVARCLAARTDRALQELLDLARVGRCVEHGEANEHARDLVYKDSDGPTEGPARGQGERKPRHPQSRANRNSGQVEVPGVAGVSGDHARTAHGDGRCSGSRAGL